MSLFYQTQDTNAQISKNIDKNFFNENLFGTKTGHCSSSVNSLSIFPVLFQPFNGETILDVNLHGENDPLGFVAVDKLLSSAGGFLNISEGFVAMECLFFGSMASKISLVTCVAHNILFTIYHPMALLEVTFCSSLPASENKSYTTKNKAHTTSSSKEERMRGSWKLSDWRSCISSILDPTTMYQSDFPAKSFKHFLAMAHGFFLV